MRIKVLFARTVAGALALWSFSTIDADTMRQHPPEFGEVVEFFESNLQFLNGIYDQYRADGRINWVECGIEGDFRVTSRYKNDDLELGTEEKRFFRRMCLALDIWLIQRVESGVSVHWKDLKTTERRYRIEFYRTDEKYLDSCKDEDFSRQISSCMVPLDTSWAVRYFWLPHNDS